MRLSELPDKAAVIYIPQSPNNTIALGATDMKRRSHVFLALTFLVFAMLSVGCATDKAVISQAQQFDSQLKPAEINDSALSDYLQRVGDRIIASARELDRQGFGPKSHKKESSEWMFGQNMK